VRDLLVIVVIIAIALVCLGAVNHDVTVDLDYVFGTWSGVSLLWLAAIVAALVIAVGLLAGGSAAVHAAGDRHKLEKELEATYSRQLPCRRPATKRRRTGRRRRGTKPHRSRTPTRPASRACRPGGDGTELPGSADGGVRRRLPVHWSE
jgi:uncharacterized integral membrane protein